MAQQRIVGFHQDLENHWVADLRCGHSQHMRHDPPWQNRLWTQSSEGRKRQIGKMINCPRCDIKGAWLQRDIRDRNDLKLLVRSFYEKAIPDAIIGFYFIVISDINVEQHVEKVTDFWNKMLFGKDGYQGRPFDTHRLLNNKAAFTPHHFYHWLYLFTRAVNNLFKGPNADKICQLAHSIANTMEHKLQKSPLNTENNAPPTPAVELWSPDNSANA